MRAEPTEVRFWRKVDIQPECWVWTGHTVGAGYGRLRHERRNILAHRFAYEHFVGPIPEGMELDHLCRETRCVNPRHLEPVTHRVNNPSWGSAASAAGDPHDLPGGTPL